MPLQVVSWVGENRKRPADKISVTNHILD